MTISQYINNISRLYKTGNSREHSYRGDLQALLMALLPDILVTNEPARIACGAPDYVLTRKDIPVGYIEAKDIGVDLNSKTLKEQFERYKAGLSNLIFTDYLDFHFYKDGVSTTSISIGTIQNGIIIPNPENFDRFITLIQNFALTISQTIKSPTKLAEMMAGKAKLMADVIDKSLSLDDETESRSALKSQMLSFQQMLIHDITNSGFADIYAQTIAYGMFAARYHDPTLPTFSRQEAATLIPKSNPFLRKLFQDIAGYDLDNRLVWIVDELVNVFLATDVADIMRNFGKSTKQEDPVIHFYETFLASYNPKLKKSRGVWYTPQPIVNFIVRAVDDILKTDFKLDQGLADTSKTKIKLKIPTHDKRFTAGMREYEQEVHKVQLLDPATGTGTFLSEVIRHIFKKFDGQQGIWNNYVNKHLIPRLNGFELLMASYAMAHLKIDMLLTETGYVSNDDKRFRIFLTNSLEEAHPDTRTLFSSWLSDEADQANAVKQETPVMVIIGNPPYNADSPNKAEWIMKLMEDYKKEPGGKERLKERNPKALNDDYVKFIRFGQYFIDKTGEGVLAFINPHGYLDNPTFRGMRWNLLKTFDKIYTLDLHGNSTKAEKSPDGSPDVNVFDIKQGVSINLFVKTGKKTAEQQGKVFHEDLFGKRESKYNFLIANSLDTIPFKELPCVAPNYFFTKKDFGTQDEYDKGFIISDLFVKYGMGIATGDDHKLISYTKSALSLRFDNEKYILPIDYRLFDKRYIYYKKDVVERGRETLMKHMLSGDNYGLISLKRVRNDLTGKFSIVNNIVDKSFISTLDNGFIFPLYQYPDIEFQTTIGDQQKRLSNLNSELAKKIANKINLTYDPEKLFETDSYKRFNEQPNSLETLGPLDILDYIYAILHSPSYRKRYTEFLKIDFPKIPFPTSKQAFLHLVKLGAEMREIHLFNSSILNTPKTQYPIDGNNIVVIPTYKNEMVFINDYQYFGNVPENIWNFYIGGYQPAQKWLKDRKGMELNFEDIMHYQKIIVALIKTDELMQEIDKFHTTG